jgi:hypothetical protein
VILGSIPVKLGYAFRGEIDVDSSPALFVE